MYVKVYTRLKNQLTRVAPERARDVSPQTRLTFFLSLVGVLRSHSVRYDDAKQMKKKRREKKEKKVALLPDKWRKFHDLN